ncbi:MAG: hypothetical protein LBI45_05190 [Bacteroidales bacterium]|jgi:hypothetical protein|nr:hypothetical protein [Bacteroidales bacterium]
MMSREEMIQDMSRYFDKKAEVGIFWYHPLLEDLFEIHSMPATSLKKEELTYPKLHKTIWQELHYSTINKKKKGLPYDPIYLSDYTQIPRGRIYFIEGEFYVKVGSWITDKIKKMIINKFNLKKCTVVFEIDIHWELGHGWSTEKDLLNFDLKKFK